MYPTCMTLLSLAPIDCAILVGHLVSLSICVLLRVFTPDQQQQKKKNENYFHIVYGKIHFIRMV